MTKKTNQIFLILFFILISSIIIASPGYSECSYNNQSLKYDLEKGYFKGTMWLGNEGDMCSWASSTLKPEGKAPNENEDEMKYYRFLSKYSPYNVFDNNKKTVWAEGATGDGIDEFLMLPLDITKKIYIRNGLSLTKKLYFDNNRIKKARIYYLIPSDVISESIGVILYSNLKVVKKIDIELKDTGEYQQLEIPIFPKNKIPKKSKHLYSDVERTVMAIQIKSVYKGLKFSDTVISDIINK